MTFFSRDLTLPPQVTFTFDSPNGHRQVPAREKQFGQDETTKAHAHDASHSPPTLRALEVGPPVPAPSISSTTLHSDASHRDRERRRESAHSSLQPEQAVCVCAAAAALAAGAARAHTPHSVSRAVCSGCGGTTATSRVSLPFLSTSSLLFPFFTTGTILECESDRKNTREAQVL